MQQSRAFSVILILAGGLVFIGSANLSGIQASIKKLTATATNNSGNDTSSVVGAAATAPFDFDKDGKIDIAVWRNGDGTWFITNSSTGTQTVVGWGRRQRLSDRAGRL